MKITYYPSLIRQNADDQTVFFTLTDDLGAKYRWHADIPKDVDVQTHLEAHMAVYLLLLRQREYPEANIKPEASQTDIEAFDTWIKDGCTLTDAQGQTLGICQKRLVKSTHPIDTSADARAQFDAARSTEERIQILAEYVFSC